MTVVCYIGGRDNFLPSPVVVGPTPPSLSVEGSNIRLYAHRPIVSPMYPASMPDGPLHSTSRFPTSTRAVHKLVTLCCVFMLAKLNNCAVVCSSDF